MKGSITTFKSDRNYIHRPVVGKCAVQDAKVVLLK